MKLADIIAVYERNLASPEVLATGEFPSAPHALPPPEFVEALIAQAAKSDVRAFHPFMRKLACGGYSAPRLRECVRQGYASVIGDIRRHALIAAAARECDLLRSLLAYAGVEADADPVGGAFFSLPQLWIKFGIALGLTREDIVRAAPCPELVKWEEAATAAVSKERVPVSIFVDAVLDCALADCLGRRLQNQLGHARDSFDYFWAIAGNRWGEDVGFPLLEFWCETSEGRREVWSRYANERSLAHTEQRLTIMQTAVESNSGQ